MGRIRILVIDPDPQLVATGSIKKGREDMMQCVVVKNRQLKGKIYDETRHDAIISFSNKNIFI